MSILSLNVGSSSIKFALFLADSQADSQANSFALSSANNPIRIIAKGSISALLSDSADFRVKVFNESGNALNNQQDQQSIALTGDMTARIRVCFARLFASINPIIAKNPLEAIGHRVVHGGLHRHEAVRMNAAILDELTALEPLAPLHEPYNLLGIRVCQELLPQVPQVACFDTAFHAHMPRLNRLYALPRALTEKGFVRYGFHGLSYEFVSRSLPRHLGRTPPRTIISHLGSGASICALHNGQSIGTSLGYSTMDGLMMGTRSGHVDAGLVLHLMQYHNYAVADVHRLLYEQSGLLGVSGQSADMRELLAILDGNAQGKTAEQRAAAAEAVELFCHRVSTEIGAWLPVLGGLDALIFCGGIGENAPWVRERIAQSLSWIGARINLAANRQITNQTHTAGSAANIGAEANNTDAKIALWVIPTDEEWVIAENAMRLMGAD